MIGLKTYLDMGAKPEAGGIISVAASVFKPTPYKQFCREWNAFLKGWDATAFHATDFYPGAREFWRKRPDGTVDNERLEMFDRDSKRIPRLIGTHARKLFVVSFKEREFECVAPLAWRERFGNVHGVAVQLALRAIGHWVDRVSYHDQIAYSLESGDDEESAIDALLKKHYTNPVLRKHTRIASHTFTSKGTARGLEVADCRTRKLPD